MDQHHYILGPYFYDILLDSSQTGPLHYDIFSHSSRMNKPFVTSIKFVMDEESIVQSAWTHLLFFAYVAWIYNVGPTCQIGIKKNFFNYCNIILCHLSGPHVALASGWPTCQLSLGWFLLNKTQNVEKTGFELATPWSLEACTTSLVLQLCCCASYYFFVLCSRVLIWPSQ
jgi:hypothetical protein